MLASKRPWKEIQELLEGRIQNHIVDATDPAQAQLSYMNLFIASLWPRLKEHGVSWIGFYKADLPLPNTTCMLLVAREPKPACSPIGLHGACGNSFKSGKPMVVRDVAELGGDYIACDPRDKSELVIPCFDCTGNAWGVIDLDSFDVGSFDAFDALNVANLLKVARLSV
jgi:putative methionine-R-sulfoxide reductase with GAF domain